ncbi:T9SS C-terminal target domain-containing protein [Haloferula sp.]|uniref:T9SS C-terminal target domain-containing protein n=1 Tax=Haloferula sp. TaxID=2497595 RepID=UPI003C72E3B7
MNHQKKLLALCALLGSPVAMAADITVSGDIAANTTWTSDNAYILNKVVFVKPGVTLTIEPGTKIYGTQDTSVTPSTYGSLVVTRGATLIAEGTVNEPIEFTALEERDGFDDDDDPGTPNVAPDPALGDGGFWGGLVMLGAAPINYYVGGVNVNENDIEGFPGGSGTDILYGGSNPTDSSGKLKYVSIRFGGFEFAANKEINGLTLGGVGSGTEIEYVEVFSNTDDGVEIFGGTVNTKHIAVAFCQDDSFDLDEGHQGHHQFWFAIQNEDDSLGDNLGEWDGGNGNILNGTPYNLVQVYNSTFIGSSNATATGNDGIAMENNFAGTLANSVITDVPDDAIRDKSDGVGDPKPVFLSNTWGIIGDAALQAVIGTGVNGDSDPAEGIQLDGIPNGSGNGSIGVDPMLIGISREADCGLDPRPQISSPLRNAVLASFPGSAPAGFFESVSYRGAFGDRNWLNGWSHLYRAGYLSGLPDGGSQVSSGGGSLTDTDGDGISDEVENANTDLGFDANVSNGTPSTVFGDLFTEDGILDLVTGSQIMIQGGGAGQPVTLSLPLFRAGDLSEFTPAPALDATFTGSGEAEFYRIQVSGAE